MKRVSDERLAEIIAWLEEDNECGDDLLIAKELQERRERERLAGVQAPLPMV